MKNLLFVGMVFGALALTSCKKNYTCSYTGFNGEPVTVTYKDVKAKDKKTANEACDFVNGSFSAE